MTTVEHGDLASPLTLLSQWQDRPGGEPLRELLVLGFTADLPFLERFAVSRARQMGARVTVVSDADHLLHDPIDVRLAGQAYQHGAVTIRGAFHPKLAVLVGEQDVWAAVGSGNPTMSGWGHNHELWCVLRGATDRGLRVQDDLGAWLQELPGHAAMPPWIAETLVDVGTAVRPSEIDDGRPDVRVLHNLDAPILDGLPAAAAEVNLAAPFFDPSGDAVRAVLDRARPDRVRIALQSELSSFDGRTLTAAVGRTTAEFRDVDDRRTLHGKLLEFVDRDGRHHAVVGSANVTSAALMRTVAGGGNCELAIAADVDGTLLPEADRVAAADVAGWNPAARLDRDERGPVLRLLGARRLDRSIEVVVVCGTVDGDVTVECSPDGAPGSWQPRGTFRPSGGEGTSVWTVGAPESAGAAVRVVATVGGAVVESVPAFVTDTHRCRPRTDVGAAPRLREAYRLEAIITDPVVLERFGRDLANLLAASAEQRAATAALRTGTPSTRGVDGRARTDPWTEFLDLASHATGSTLVDLAFPGALPSPVAVTAPSGWAVGVVEDETELADGEGEDVVDEIDPPVERTARRVEPEARARYRSWIRRWVRAITPAPPAPVPPLPLRMTVAALYVELLAAGVWAADDGWRDGLADVVLALVADREEIAGSPERSHAYLGSLVASCLAVLGQGATIRGGSPADVVLTGAWEPAHDVAALAEDAVVDALLLRSEQTGARFAARAEVATVVELARRAATDPHAETLAALAGSGLDVVREHGAWVVRGTFSRPLRPVARAATDLFDGTPMTCVATTGSHSVIMARNADTVALLDSAVGRWRIHRVPRPRTPLTVFGQGDGPPAPLKILAAHPIPPAVTALAGEADLAALVAAFGPRRPSRPKDGAWTDWDW